MNEIREEILAVIENCNACIEEITCNLCIARSGRRRIKNPIDRETADEKIATLMSYRRRLKSTKEELENSLLCLDGLVNKW